MNRPFDTEPAGSREITGTFIMDQSGMPFEGQLALVAEFPSGSSVGNRIEPHLFYMDGMGVRFQFDPSLIDGCTGFPPTAMTVENRPMQVMLPQGYIPAE